MNLALSVRCFDVSLFLDVSNRCVHIIYALCNHDHLFQIRVKRGQVISFVHNTCKEMNLKSIPSSPAKGKAKETTQWRTGWWDYYSLTEYPKRSVFHIAIHSKLIVFKAIRVVKLISNFHCPSYTTTGYSAPFLILKAICYTFSDSSHIVAGRL